MTVVLALDAMGGDAAPNIVMAGAQKAIEKNPGNLRFLVFGDRQSIEKCLASFPNLREVTSVIHTDVVIKNDTKPSVALRQGRKSSLGMAIQSVADEQAQAVVSAGNTGAYMALSKILLKALPGIDRPAIPAILPTLKGRSVVLDLGANIDCTAQNLVQFALMGEAFASYLLGIEKPSVGLLNVGSEDMKGNAVVQESAQILRKMPNFSFHGFVEGDDITAGTTDVVVTDGFSGNIALKSIEGAAKLIRHFLKESLSSSWRGKLGYLISKPAFANLQRRIDPRLYNGAAFLGLQKIAIKSHGGTDALGFSSAIQVAYNMVEKNLISGIKKRLMALPESGL